jgi:hypothetical protein
VLHDHQGLRFCTAEGGCATRSIAILKLALSSDLDTPSNNHQEQRETEDDHNRD